MSRAVFDPHVDQKACEQYLSAALGGRVELVHACQLTGSTREAPWRLDVLRNGSAQSLVMQLDPRGLEQEYRVLKALEGFDVPTPHAYGLDLEGQALGSACFVRDFVVGDSLLQPMVDAEPWAETVYFDAVCALHAVTPADLGDVKIERLSAEDVLVGAGRYFDEHPHPLAQATYARLNRSRPDLPPLRFSNGDLWLDNFIVDGRQLVGVIDFQHAAFSDPIFEFLLSFFVEPRLRDRGTEERFCRRLGYDPAILDWYRGLELFDTWRAVLMNNEPFVHHTAASLEVDIQRWLQGESAPQTDIDAH
jgi:aminoglycoside phosphotransferase (APT) family kinase protein